MSVQGAVWCVPVVAHHLADTPSPQAVHLSPPPMCPRMANPTTSHPHQRPKGCPPHCPWSLVRSVLCAIAAANTTAQKPPAASVPIRVVKVPLHPQRPTYLRFRQPPPTTLPIDLDQLFPRSLIYIYISSRTSGHHLKKPRLKDEHITST